MPDILVRAGGGDENTNRCCLWIQPIEVDIQYILQCLYRHLYRVPGAENTEQLTLPSKREYRIHSRNNGGTES